MIKRLESVDGPQTVAALRVILAEKTWHVAIGTRWFNWCCEQRSLDSEAVFRKLLADYYSKLKGPFNIPARLEAGFTRSELECLQS